MNYRLLQWSLTEVCELISKRLRTGLLLTNFYDFLTRHLKKRKSEKNVKYVFSNTDAKQKSSTKTPKRSVAFHLQANARHWWTLNRHIHIQTGCLFPILSSTLPGPSTSEVTTLWSYINILIIIIIISVYLLRQNETTRNPLTAPQVTTQHSERFDGEHIISSRAILAK